MKLVIEGSRSLQEVQHQFSAAYPFLKIEFFRPRNGVAVATTAANMLTRSMKIDDARHVQSAGSIEVTDMTKVSELENVFREKYGLNVQVFRKSGNIWLETTMSDDWTLQQQNEHAKEIFGFSNNHNSRGAA